LFHAHAYNRGDDFSVQSKKYHRPLYLMAHHDDEVATAGLLQRLGSNTRVVWVTNSDGLYYESKLAPEKYAAVRQAEGIESVGVIGIPPSHARCLAFSEIEIYRRLSELHSGVSTIEDVRLFFNEIKDAIQKVVFEIQPDAVFTLAWQGGQPEHDLIHFFTRLALEELEEQTGAKPDFFHCPAYEYTILIALRFHPLYPGSRIRLRLNSEELFKKLQMVKAYPSQVRLFEKFRRVFNLFGMSIGRVLGASRTPEEFLSVEEFGPVPEDLDYTARPHLLDFFTYMFDDFQGTPVTFTKSVLPIVKAFL